jgi:hypothetical protein
MAMSGWRCSGQLSAHAGEANPDPGPGYGLGGGSDSRAARLGAGEQPSAAGPWQSWANQLTRDTARRRWAGPFRIARRRRGQLAGPREKKRRRAAGLCGLWANLAVLLHCWAAPRAQARMPGCASWAAAPAC